MSSTSSLQERESRRLSGFWYGSEDRPEEARGNRRGNIINGQQS